MARRRRFRPQGAGVRRLAIPACSMPTTEAASDFQFQVAARRIIALPSPVRLGGRLNTEVALALVAHRARRWTADLPGAEDVAVASRRARRRRARLRRPPVGLEEAMRIEQTRWRPAPRRIIHRDISRRQHHSRERGRSALMDLKAVRAGNGDFPPEILRAPQLACGAGNVGLASRNEATDIAFATMFLRFRGRVSYGQSDGTSLLRPQAGQAASSRLDLLAWLQARSAPSPSISADSAFGAMANANGAMEMEKGPDAQPDYVRGPSRSRAKGAGSSPCSPPCRWYRCWHYRWRRYW